METYIITVSYAYDIKADNENQAREMALKRFEEAPPRADEVNVELEYCK